MLRRRSSESKKISHVVWDEKNLEENEKIKAELTAVKILEPKTPYHGPSQNDEFLDEDMKPLHLDETGDGGIPFTVTNGELFLPMGGTEKEGCGQDKISESGSGVVESRTNSGFTSGHSSDAEAGVVTSARSGSSGDGHWSSDGEEKGIKKRRFEMHRKAHYNMRAALMKGRELLQEEPVSPLLSPKSQSQPPVDNTT